MLGFIINIFLADNIKATSNAVSQGIFYQNVNDNTIQAQVNFQHQVQEWKNILYRGNNSGLHSQYLKQFESREKTVN